MRHFLTILSHEIRMLLVNTFTYIAAFLFLAVMGSVFTFLILESYSKSPQETSPANVFFQVFWLPVFFMVPLLTMKSISEERRMGTLETLLTTPVTTTEVVLGKYGAAYFMYLLLWGSTGGFFYIVQKFSHDPHFLDLVSLIGGYAFIAVSGLFFVAIGIFASALSRNQAVASFLAFTMLFALIWGVHFASGLEFLRQNVFLQPAKAAIDYAQIFTHLEDFTRGVLDIREVLFYVSGTVLALIFSILAVEAKLLHS